jgi:predicted nucleic acid-binding Zn ribbon protein
MDAASPSSEDNALTKPRDGERMPELNPAFVFIIVLVVVFLVAVLSGKGTARLGPRRMCKSCGAIHPDYAKFCRRCGEKL